MVHLSLNLGWRCVRRWKAPFGPKPFEVQKQFYLPLNKNSEVPFQHDFQIPSISHPFCHVLTKTTQSESRH